MEFHYHGLLGAADCQQGLCSGIQEFSQRKVLAGSNLKEPTETQTQIGGDPAPPPDQGNRASPHQTEGIRGLLCVFLGSKEEWQLAGHSGFKMVEPLPKKEEIQDRDMEIHSSFSPVEKFPSFFGSHRGLPTCPHPRETPKVLKVLL